MPRQNCHLQNDSFCFERFLGFFAGKPFCFFTLEAGVDMRVMGEYFKTNNLLLRKGDLVGSFVQLKVDFFT